MIPLSAETLLFSRKNAEREKRREYKTGNSTAGAAIK